ncbi:hypothetical protein GCM10010495_80140 [Kitasatospora herbaricolor]|nr:hypothetical protein GCM10010495_80140 [Kitasatospora herbaricolor]
MAGHRPTKSPTPAAEVRRTDAAQGRPSWNAAGTPVRRLPTVGLHCPPSPFGRLITDARDRGWEREIERHQRIADPIASLLDDLGEPHDEPAE